MQRSILMCAAVLSTVFSLSATADGMGGMNIDKKGDMAGMQKKAVTAHGVGVVKAIDAKTLSVTLAHGPIAEVRWPAMTMAFNVADAKMLAGITVGQTVAFGFSSEGMSATIIDIKSTK